MARRPIISPGRAGPNDFQNYPIFTSAVTDGKYTTVTGTLIGADNATYTVQMFWNLNADPLGYGQGQNLFSTIPVATDSNGNGYFSLTLPTSVPPGAAISATATDTSGNTSEFSPDITTQGQTSLVVSIDASPSPVGIGNTLTYTVSVTNTGSLAAHDVNLTDQLPGQFLVKNSPPARALHRGFQDRRSPHSLAQSAPAARPR